MAYCSGLSGIPWSTVQGEVKWLELCILHKDKICQQGDDIKSGSEEYGKKDYTVVLGDTVSCFPMLVSIPACSTKNE